MFDRNYSGREVSRRQTLAAVTGATVSGLAGVPTTVVGDSGREKRVTILASGDESRETVTVSKRWYRHKQQAIKVKEAMSRQFLGEGSIHSVGIESSDTVVGDLRGKRVRVTADPEGDVSALDAVPSAVEGIPVRTVEEERPRQTACYNDRRDDVDGDGENEFLGGMAFEGMKNIDDGGDAVEAGTLCCPVQYNGGTYMLTARHVISGDVCKTPGITESDYGWGRTGNNEDSVTPFGFVEAALPDYDAALLTLESSDLQDFSGRITDEPDAEVVGRVTGDGIDTLASYPATTVCKRSRKTCATSGTIVSSRLTFKYDCGPFGDEQKEYGQVRTSATQEKGDSGGPVYLPINDSSGTDELYLLNVATRNYGSDDYAQGSSADILHDQEDISFGSEKYY
ncbi:hypothetical protein [Halobaculum sp. MBLA0143]|uniref:hypothetical protein n=1 Tax=Halobaculum sp. MBLA0143 TaxID=3079933 RepID=UPI00352581E6